ncbi:MAG TPA: hypothetical protein VN791_08075 [Acidimicrobiales bacterium]|nr:hypothetical protein [Acidimicrobiales bacterium]
MSPVANNADVTVEVRSPTRPSLSRRLILWLATRGIGWDKDPWLVAVNRWGGTFPLFRASCPEEAFSKKERLEAEIQALGIATWADRYTVPGTFFSSDWLARDLQAR